MIITAQDKLYTQALELFTGKQRNRLNGTDLDLYNAGVSDPLLLYVVPIYDPATQKFGALVNVLDGTCTHLVVSKTQVDLDNDLAAERESLILSRYQFRAGINGLGGSKRTDLEAYVALTSQTEQDWWMHGDNYPRLHTNIEAMAASLGFSASNLDTFFRESALLT